MQTNNAENQRWLAGLIFLGLLVFYAYRIDFPPMQYYDEVYRVESARELIALREYTDTTHPLLTGWPVSEGYFWHHMWFRSWV